VEGALYFDNYRGITPYLWAFCSLAVLELVAVHIFVGAKWPTLAWPLSILTLISIVWLLFWILSWRRLPHELRLLTLTIHMGSLKSLCIQTANIQELRTAFAGVDLQKPGVRNFVPVAFPNRLIMLKSPLDDRRKTCAIAIRLDKPGDFDEALTSLGIDVKMT
jgi:hypothetical protein